MEKKLFNTDFVIYNPTKNYVVRWDVDDDVVLYGDKEEAIEDCREEDGEQVIPCTELPEDLQQLVINQLKKQDDEWKCYEVELILLDTLGSIGMDKPSNFDSIVQYCFEDICETADADDWNNSDVVIALRRFIENK